MNCELCGSECEREELDEEELDEEELDEEEDGYCDFCGEETTPKQIAKWQAQCESERAAAAVEAFFAALKPRVAQHLIKDSMAVAEGPGTCTVCGQEYPYGPHCCRPPTVGTCLYCGADGEIHYDHVVPSSRGGGDSHGNIVPACVTCNLRKSDKTPSEAGIDQPWALEVERNFRSVAKVLPRRSKLSFGALFTTPHGTKGKAAQATLKRLDDRFASLGVAIFHDEESHDGSR